MNTPSTFFTFQYQLVLQSRDVLFAYCEGLPQSDFLNENSSFGRGGSIRNLLVHIANTYEYWIIHHALQKDIEFTPYISITTMQEMRLLFRNVDKEMAAFISKFQDTAFKELELQINDIPKRISPIQLFTHVITHEFHHKGQVLSLSRHLGHVPVDTDVIR